MRKLKQTKRKPSTRQEVRYPDVEQHEIVKSAALLRNQSVNSWIVHVSLVASRRELRKWVKLEQDTRKLNAAIAALKKR